MILLLCSNPLLILVGLSPVNSLVFICCVASLSLVCILASALYVTLVFGALSLLGYHILIINNKLLAFHMDQFLRIHINLLPLDRVDYLIIEFKNILLRFTLF